MIIFDQGGGEPRQWFVCFSHKAATPWLDRLPIGKYKHVRAFGCVGEINTWVFFDPGLDRTAINLARGSVVDALMAEFIHDAAVILVPAQERKSLRPRVFGWCVPAVANLLGLESSALRPDAFYRDCLRHEGAVLQPPAD